MGDSWGRGRAKCTTRTLPKRPSGWRAFRVQGLSRRRGGKVTGLHVRFTANGDAVSLTEGL